MIAPSLATMPGGNSKLGLALKAADQARKAIRTLTEVGIVAHLFMNSEEGPEMHGEDDFLMFMLDIYEEKNAIEKAKSIKMRGNYLSHGSTRKAKIQTIQEAFGTNLPPPPISFLIYKFHIPYFNINFTNIISFLLIQK